MISLELWVNDFQGAFWKGSADLREMLNLRIVFLLDLEADKESILIYITTSLSFGVKCTGLNYNFL